MSPKVVDWFTWNLAYTIYIHSSFKLEPKRLIVHMIWPPLWKNRLNLWKISLLEIWHTPSTWVIILSFTQALQLVTWYGCFLLFSGKWATFLELCVPNLMWTSLQLYEKKIFEGLSLFFGKSEWRPNHVTCQDFELKPERAVCVDGVW